MWSTLPPPLLFHDDAVDGSHSVKNDGSKINHQFQFIHTIFSTYIVLIQCCGKVWPENEFVCFEKMFTVSFHTQLYYVYTTYLEIEKRAWAMINTTHARSWFYTL